MSALYQSISTGTASNGGSGAVTDVIVAKPSGLAIGDLMVAFIDGAGGSSTTYSCSGWTADSSYTLVSTGLGVSATILYKTADSGDVAASTFTFTAALGQAVLVGAIMRITQGNTVTPIFAIAGDVNNASNTPSYSNAIVPEANDLLIMYVAGYGFTSTSGYAIATSNPTWTERVDLTENTSNAGLVNIAIATATRSQSTNTGNASVSLVGSGRTGCVLIAIKSTVIINVSDTVTMTDTLSRMCKKFFTEVLTMTDTLVSTKTRLWRSVAKPITIWRSRNK